jgi:hypothetical protein
LASGAQDGVDFLTTGCSPCNTSGGNSRRFTVFLMDVYAGVARRRGLCRLLPLWLLFVFFIRLVEAAFVVLFLDVALSDVNAIVSQQRKGYPQAINSYGRSR